MASTGEVWTLGHRPALDGVRGIAILLVLADHAGFMPGPAGTVGVTVFFVLSGFLISRVIIEARNRDAWSFRGFFLNRAVRLAPALVLMVAVVCAAWLSLGAAGSTVARSAVPALLYAQNIAPVWDAPFAHTWSLAVEEQFYLVWPVALLWLLARRRPVRHVGVLVAVFVGLRIVLAVTGGDGGSLRLESNAYALLLGCGLAVAPAHWVQSAPQWVTPVGAAGIAAVLLVAPAWPDRYLWGPMAAVTFALLVVWGSVAGNRVLEVGWLRFAGRISYALYLWHFPLLLLTRSTGAGVRAVPVLLGAAVIAAASTLWLEEPMRRAWRLRQRDDLHYGVPRYAARENSGRSA